MLEAGWLGGSLCIGGVMVRLRLGTRVMYTKCPGLVLKMARGGLLLERSVDWVLLWVSAVGGGVVMHRMTGGLPTGC